LDFLRNLCNADIMVAFVGRGANSAKKLIWNLAEELYGCISVRFANLDWLWLQAKSLVNV
jgi:hypothetical protein